MKTKFENLEIGKKYHLIDKYQQGDISYVAEIIDVFFNKKTLEPEIICKPVFWIYGRGCDDERRIDYSLWNIVYGDVEEVTWTSKQDCLEYFL